MTAAPDPTEVRALTGGEHERAAQILRDARDGYRKRFPEGHVFSPSDQWAYALIAVRNAFALASATEAPPVAGMGEELRIGDKVEVVGKYEADYRGQDWWVAGIRVHDSGEGLDVTIAEQWPIPNRHWREYRGQTDGFRPEELRVVAALTKPTPPASDTTPDTGGEHIAAPVVGGSCGGAFQGFCTCRSGRDHDGSEFGPCAFCEANDESDGDLECPFCSNQPKERIDRFGARWLYCARGHSQITLSPEKWNDRASLTKPTPPASVSGEVVVADTAETRAIDRAEAHAKSTHTTLEEHDDIMVAVRLARHALGLVPMLEAARGHSPSTEGLGQ